MSTELATHQHQNVNQGSLAVVRDTMEALKAIRTFIKEEFERDIDFGVIPGTGSKPALLQPGAQKTAMCTPCIA